MEYTIDGETYWLPDNLPDDMTRSQMRALAIPMRLRNAQLEVARLDAELASCYRPDDAALLEWARTNHPSAAAAALLNTQMAEQLALIEEYRK